MTQWALPEIKLALCDRCGACIAECPAGVVEMGPDGPIIARAAECSYCASCEAICPQGAIVCTYEIVWAPEQDKQ